MHYSSYRQCCCGGIDFQKELEWLRIGTIDHILNLIVRAGLNETYVANWVTKERALVTYFHKSSPAKGHFLRTNRSNWQLQQILVRRSKSRTSWLLMWVPNGTHPWQRWNDIICIKNLFKHLLTTAKSSCKVFNHIYTWWTQFNSNSNSFKLFNCTAILSSWPFGALMIKFNSIYFAHLVHNNREIISARYCFIDHH